MQEVMGPLPGTEKRVSLDVRLLEEVDCGSYVRRLIDYASEPGGRVPAYLPFGYIPDTRQRIIIYRKLAQLSNPDESVSYTHLTLPTKRIV